MVVDALGDGKRAARDIDRVLGAGPLRPEDPVEVMPYEKLNTAYFRHAPRTEAPLAPAQARRASQVTEVTLAYSREQAVAEADRCMSCGVCNGCDKLLHRVPRRQRDAGRAAERALLHPHPLLQGLPGLRAGVPHRLPGAGAGARLRRAGRRGPDGDRVRAYEGAHAEQAPFTRQLIEDAIAEYDRSRSLRPNGGGDTP